MPGGENYGSPLNGGTLCGTTIYYDADGHSRDDDYYTVEAVNAAGVSVASAEASTLTLPAAPDVNASSVSPTQINLTWTAAGWDGRRIQHLSRHDERWREHADLQFADRDHVVQLIRGDGRLQLLLHRQGGERFRLEPRLEPGKCNNSRRASALPLSLLAGSQSAESAGLTGLRGGDVRQLVPGVRRRCDGNARRPDGQHRSPCVLFHPQRRLRPPPPSQRKS